ncbi:hypothetical protein I3843_06G038700 [Carya illinoinensis]|nr:hypothetical protein I3843_06G038700 [Carya illinoinensis]
MLCSFNNRAQIHAHRNSWLRGALVSSIWEKFHVLWSKTWNWSSISRKLQCRGLKLASSRCSGVSWRHLLLKVVFSFMVSSSTQNGPQHRDLQCQSSGFVLVILWVSRILVFKYVQVGL